MILLPPNPNDKDKNSEGDGDNRKKPPLGPDVKGFPPVLARLGVKKYHAKDGL